MLILTMLPTINFNNQLLFITHKINDIFTDYGLPAEFHTHAFYAQD